MFFNSNKTKAPNSKPHTLIGGKAEIRGDVGFDGGLFVDGAIIGNVEADADSASLLNVSERGSIEGQVRVPHIVLSGTVIGDVYAFVRVELTANARVTGNVYYSLIEMAAGAEINGQMVHQTEAKSPLLEMSPARSGGKAGGDKAAEDDATDATEAAAK